MRKPIYFTLLLITLLPYSKHLFAQPCGFVEDYASDAGWTDFYWYYAVTGACISDNQNGTLSFTGGQLNFNNVNDANDTRFYQVLPVVVNEDFWTISTEFTPTAGGALGRTDAIVVALSEGTDNPISDTYSICEYSNTDALFVMWASEFAAAPENIGFEIWGNDNGITYVSERVAAPYGDTYYLQFTRVAYNYMTLDIYLDVMHTELFGSVPCLEVPSSIDGLTTMQHGNFPGGSYQRKLTATLDNTCFRNIDVVAASITGPTSICIGSINEYTMTTLSGADITWVIPDGIDYTTGGGAGATITVNDWPAVGTYTLTCIINYNCFYDTAYLDVTVIDPGSSIIIDEAFCEGGNTTVNVEQTGATYLWDDGTTEATHNFETAGTYWVIVSVGECFFTDTINITEYPLPTIELGDDLTICGNTEVTGPSGFNAYFWNNGLSTQSFVTSVPGDYTLTVTDENGCTTSDFITLINGCDDHIDLPSAFSPNNDNVNDFFGPIYSGNITDYHIEIYNRWGQLVFETNKLDKAWDGTFEQEVQLLGAFTYVMTASLNNKSLVKQGSFILVR